MKKLLVFLCIVFVFACGGDEKKNKATFSKGIVHETKNLVDIKVDTTEFRKVIQKVMPTKLIYNLFGSGYHNFYLLLIVTPEKEKAVLIFPDASTITGDNSTNLSYMDNVEIVGDYAIRHTENDNIQTIKIKDVFNRAYFTFNNVFSYLDTIPQSKLKKVPFISRNLFQIDFSINSRLQITAPWSIKEIVDINKFSPHVSSRMILGEQNSIFPAVLKDDYKSLKEKVIFPTQALKRGVSGKVLVKLFFDDKGKYEGYQIIKGLGYGSEEAVIKAISDYPLASYPSGQRSTAILPFSFGNPSLTEVDYTTSGLQERYPEEFNNLYLEWSNNLSLTKPITTQYKVVVNINGETINASLFRVNEKKQALWFRWKPVKPGTYDYVVSIDPENVLNDVDRSNNTVRGKLVIK